MLQLTIYRILVYFYICTLYKTSVVVVLKSLKNKELKSLLIIYQIKKIKKSVELTACGFIFIANK